MFCESAIQQINEFKMSVTEIGLLHARYVRLSDRFKSIWTYHQFASGLFKNLVRAPLPYNVILGRATWGATTKWAAAMHAAALRAPEAIDFADMDAFKAGAGSPEFATCGADAMGMGVRFSVEFANLT